MSKNKQTKPKPVDQHEAVHTDTMSPLKRWSIIGVAVFCLLIFSVTGSMTQVLGGMFGGGPPLRATVELPEGGHTEINVNTYRTAVSLKHFAGNLPAQMRLDPFFGRDTEEDILTYCTLMLLADDLGVMVTGDQLQGVLSPFAAAGEAGYKQYYRNLGYGTAPQFEAQIARALKVLIVLDLLSAAAVPTEAMVFDTWTKDNEEMDVQYTVWHPSQFEDAAAALEPTEEELQTFFDEDLGAYERGKLEIPQAVTFEAVLLSADALESDAVKAWFTPTEPTEEELNGFYQINKSRIYLRPEPEEGVEVDPELGRLLSKEEIGDDLRKDYLLNQAIGQLGLDLVGAEDSAAFATEKGAEHLVYAEMVPPSELVDVDRIGDLQLNVLFQSEAGTWSSQPLKKRGMTYYVRVTEKRERTMPELVDIREDVVALWRDQQKERLAEEAADAFVAALPRGEDYVEGDPVTVDAETFANAVGSEGRALEQMGWLSRQARRTVDPVWPTDATVLRGLRSRVGFELDDLLDTQIVGPEDFGEDGIAVAHLKGRRDADVDSMWPAELDNARARAIQTARTEFITDQLSFEGFADSYGLKKVIIEVEDETAE
ncbi:MAG: hypothetical protein GY747_03495 [Planctomycetes bacterium]|nr:hypothetical protein [Planctomycetota bacterium]MCP4772314.1 hypothetical protein [Planctomycetota bacterium]MCP4861586.1 hypothetical protein [Planctomycetota bacterium]